MKFSYLFFFFFFFFFHFQFIYFSQWSPRHDKSFFNKGHTIKVIYYILSIADNHVQYRYCVYRLDQYKVVYYLPLICLNIHSGDL